MRICKYCKKPISDNNVWNPDQEGNGYHHACLCEMDFENLKVKKGDNNMENTKENLKVDTSAGLLIAESYNDGQANGIKISLNGNAVALVDVTDDGEIRLLGYKEHWDEPSFFYSVNR